MDAVQWRSCISSVHFEQVKAYLYLAWTSLATSSQPTSCFYFLVTPDAVSFVPVGCYRDSVLAKARTLPELVHNYRWPKGQKEFDWNNLNKTIEACAREVNKKGYLYFGIQFYGECWSGPEGHLTFDRVKTSKHCIKGVGKSWTNFVYRLAGQGRVRFVLRVIFIFVFERLIKFWIKQTSKLWSTKSPNPNFA